LNPWRAVSYKKTSKTKGAAKSAGSTRRTTGAKGRKGIHRQLTEAGIEFDSPFSVEKAGSGLSDRMTASSSFTVIWM
jgi:hypothetical protein